jgi:hypothetical protein
MLVSLAAMNVDLARLVDARTASKHSRRTVMHQRGERALLGIWGGMSDIITDIIKPFLLPVPI